ncbi:MAG TPA: glycerate kinase [Bacteroidota bacterium]|nr:glycerate kinase [Bacteroidota bacterium]
MTLLLSPNAMKGSLSAFEAARVMQMAIAREASDTDTIVAPIADGGNGTLDCLALALDAKYRSQIVTGPIGRFPVPARWGMLRAQRTAIIEMAEASGLHLISERQYDALRASTFGTGELIFGALNEGVQSIVLGLGGSATNDGGAGCLRALGVKFLDSEGNELPDGGAALARLHSIDRSHIDPRLESVEFTILSDVHNPLCGVNGASVVFGPQKGATKDDVKILDEALAHYACVLKEECGRDVCAIPGSGAAGGFAAGLLAFFPRMNFVSGIEYVLDALEFDRLLEECDAVLTSEGMIDAQTAQGKAISGVCRRARAANKPVHAFVGSINGDATLIAHQLGLASLTEISPHTLSLHESMAHAKEFLDQSISLFLAATAESA